jgi:hypothetical protein
MIQRTGSYPRRCSPFAVALKLDLYLRVARLVAPAALPAEAETALDLLAGAARTSERVEIELLEGAVRASTGYCAGRRPSRSRAREGDLPDQARAGPSFCLVAAGLRRPHGLKSRASRPNNRGSSGGKTSNCDPTNPPDLLEGWFFP